MKSESLTHNEYVASVRHRIGKIASEMIGGELSFLEGARKLIDLRHVAEIDDNDIDFKVFVVIESDTDDLPLGEVRKLWIQKALKDLDAEILEAESWARETGFSACESLVDRFGLKTG